MSFWENIHLIVSDFDGVMTDNRVWINEMGQEAVCVSRADGQGINILRNVGIGLVIISTETNGVVAKRAEKMGVECMQGIADKALCLKQCCAEKKVLLQNICYVGNDVNDLQAMQLAGVKVVPNDAYKVVKDIADYVTESKGGYGVIREIAERIKESRK